MTDFLKMYAFLPISWNLNNIITQQSKRRINQSQSKLIEIQFWGHPFHHLTFKGKSLIASKQGDGNLVQELTKQLLENISGVITDMNGEDESLPGVPTFC